MNQKKYIVKGTPVVPSFCAIGMVVLWYLFFFFSDGKWVMDINTVSFSDLSATELYFTVLEILVPILFFLCVLFLAELDLKWMLLSMLAFVVEQLSFYVYYFKDSPEYIFKNPIRFAAPFVVLILFVLTIERVIPTKWVFVGFCSGAVLLPLVLTLCGVGEFTYSYKDYGADYTIVSITTYLWSELISYGLYYVALAALSLQMRPPRESDFVTMEELKQAYAEKIAARKTEAAEDGSLPSREASSLKQEDDGDGAGSEEDDGSEDL